MNKKEKNIEKVKEILKENQKEKSKRKKYNFNPDPSLKKLFINLKPEKLIDILNYMFEIKFSKESIVKFLNTESSKVRGKQNKEKIIGDLMIEITDNKTKESKNVVIEFQSSTDNEMADRIFMYALSKSKYINGVREIADGVIIYTELTKPKTGYEILGLAINKFEICGQEYGVNDIIHIRYKYINLLAINFDEYLNSPIEILKIIYLYKYRKNIKNIGKENFMKILEDCKKYLDTLYGIEKIILTDIYMQIVTDIENICIAKNIYKEELEMVEKSNLTIGEKLIETGREEGREEGEKEAKTKNAIALLGVISNELIAEKIGLTIEEVEELEKNK